MSASQFDKSSPIPPTFFKKLSGSKGFLTGNPRKGDRFIPSSTSISSFKMGLGPSSINRPKIGHPSGYFMPSKVKKNIPDHQIAIRTQSGRRAGGIGGVNSIGSSPGRGGASTRFNAPLYSEGDSSDEEKTRHEGRLAFAINVDLYERSMLFGSNNHTENQNLSDGDPGKCSLNVWKEGWASNLYGPDGDKPNPRAPAKRAMPVTPFRVLDAPGLRDDYYTSLLAYSPVSHALAVGLNSEVYMWTETGGAQPFEPWSSSYVTCLGFSSAIGGHNILAIGRIDGNLSLWKPGECAPRIDKQHQSGVSCVAWRPTPQIRKTEGSEEILVGEESGAITIYCVVWNAQESAENAAPVDATITTLRRIHIHSQQICGLAWSVDGKQFASGGNDNLACLFDAPELYSNPSNSLVVGGERYRWTHSAAVKAIAFCPWQKTLLATGGGSNDRSIHFFHTTSGACLATINVSSQVTSLIWSTTHREIAATFGYANPEHPVRIAVFSWPECVQVVAIPWGEDMRALYGIAYPAGPSSGKGNRHGGSEGCIVAAASDETVRFHEVWAKGRRNVTGWRGVLGASSILEDMEGIDDESEVIR